MSTPTGVSRRRLLGLGAAAAVAGATATEAVSAVAGAGGGASARASAPAADVVPFHGPHQAGIATPVQDRLHMAAFDLTTDDRAALVGLLQRWTQAAAALTAGREVGTGAVPAQPVAPPDDTGEALGLHASRLSLTFGLGPGVFADKRFGLAGRRPAALADLPRFPGDVLDPRRSGGDLVVQACADDPQVAVHAIRNLARLGFGDASVRWSQLGFGKTSSTTPSQQTPRSLFGFKDGTANIAGDDDAALARHVWADRADGAEWMHGGSYLVARRIAMTIETWDRSSLAEQEQVTGRHKGSGAPLGKPGEHDAVDVAALPRTSHVALAHPSANGGHRLLRRGYSFVDGSDGLGHLDSGLFFIAFCRDPRTQYVPMQTRLSSVDAMAEYLRHTGSGLWAVPPGVQPGGYWAQSLLEA